MEACYYCGGPLQPGADSCRFCGSPVDPLDVPLCESETTAELDEPAILQVSEVEPPPAILYEDPEPEIAETGEIPEEEPEEAAAEAEPEVSAVKEAPEPPVPVPESSAGAAEPAEPEIRFTVQAIPETDRACMVTGYEGSPGRLLAVPDVIEGMNVVGIGKSAFAHGSFEEIVIPASVQRIGDYAFTGCMGLRTVSGGQNIREIGRGAFNACLNLCQCAFLFNAGLRRPDDPMLDRVIHKLNAGQAADSGDQV